MAAHSANFNMGERGPYVVVTLQIDGSEDERLVLQVADFLWDELTAEQMQRVLADAWKRAISRFGGTVTDTLLCNMKEAKRGH